MQWPCASLNNADLGARTTLRVGGAVEWLLEPANPDELREAFVRAKDAGFTPRILGGGANLVIDDRGLPGVVIATDRMNRVFRPMAAPPGADEASGAGLLDEAVRARAWRRPTPPTTRGWWPGRACPPSSAARHATSATPDSRRWPRPVARRRHCHERGGKDPDGTLWQMSDVVERIRLVGSDGEFMDVDAEEWAPEYRRPAR